MSGGSLDDLATFVAVARERNFTRAAAKLGVSPSAISQTIRGLEDRLGVRLLNRTTRSVTQTEAGERLFQGIEPMLDQIDAQLEALSDMRGRPAGHIRISADEIAMQFVLWPKMREVLRSYPEIQLELATENSLVDIVAERFDAGVRIGEVIAADMIAVPIGPEIRMAVVASPGYLARHPAPKKPSDLTRHSCLNLRLPTLGGFHPWEFYESGREFHVRLEGPLVVNSNAQLLAAVREGFGFAQMFDFYVEPYIKSGELVEVLPEWSEPFAGYHLYYPSRRQQTAGFRAVLDALRYRA